MADRKKAEAAEHIRQAEKCMKTGLLKWKPDLDGAAYEYGKAAVAYRNAKCPEEAASTYLRCAELQRKGGSAFHAAKSMESAALIYKELNKMDKAADLVEEAANLYLEHGIPDTAAIALDKAAKMIEQVRPERAVQLFGKGADISEGEDRPRQAAELTGKAARILIRLRKLDEAAEMLKKEMDYHSQVENHGLINKLVLGLVMVHLHRGDYVAGDLAMQAALSGYDGFATSEEAPSIEALLEAYNDGDQEAADRVINSPLFKFMENDFTKLARDLRVPGGQKKKSNNSAAGDQGAAASSPQDDDDDYAGGLL